MARITITPLKFGQGIEYAVAHGVHRANLKRALSNAGFKPASVEDTMHARYVSCTEYNQGNGSVSDSVQTAHDLLWQNGFYTTDYVHYQEDRKAVITAGGRSHEFSIPDGDAEPELRKGLDTLVVLSLLQNQDGVEKGRLEAYLQASRVHQYDGCSHASSDFYALQQLLYDKRFDAIRTIPVTFAQEHQRQRGVHGLCIGPQGEGVIDSRVMKGELRPKYMLGHKMTGDVEGGDVATFQISVILGNAGQTGIGTYTYRELC